MTLLALVLVGHAVTDIEPLTARRSETYRNALAANFQIRIAAIGAPDIRQGEPPAFAPQQQARLDNIQMARIITITEAFDKRATDREIYLAVGRNP